MKPITPPLSELLCCHWVSTPDELRACWPALNALMAHWDYWQPTHSDTDTLFQVFASYLPWVWLVTNPQHQAVACCALSDWSHDTFDMDGRGWVFIHGAKLSAYRKHPLLRTLVIQALHSAFETRHCAWVLAEVMPGNYGALGFCRLWGFRPLPNVPDSNTGRCYGLSRQQYLARFKGECT